MKRRDEVAVGALLVVTLLLGVGGTMWIARGGLSSGYEMYAKFPWGAGLKVGQPVLLAGVNIGFVSDVDLIPDGTLLVKMSIKKDYHVPIGSTATVAANGIFGDQLIALTPIRATTQFLPEKDTIPTGVPSPGISDLLAKGDSITNDVKALTGKVRSELIDDGGLKDIRKAISDMSVLMAQITTVVKDQSGQLTQTQAAVRHTLASIDSSKVDSTIVNFRSASANLEKLTRSLDTTRTQVNALLAKANSKDGNIGLLLNDRALYDRMNSAVAQVDSLIADIKKNPKKYINVKVF